MRVAFLHVGMHTLLPAIMVASVRKQMPGVEIIQMTCPRTETIPGVNFRSEIDYEPDYKDQLMVYRLLHLSRLEAPLLILDTDVIVQSDLRPLFDQDFDVAMVNRGTGPIVLSDFTIPPMPYNSGVIAVKSDAFLKAWSSYELTNELRGWWGDQVALAETAKAFNVLELPDDFNYSPSKRKEDVTQKKIVHYKGRRKPWMLERLTVS